MDRHPKFNETRDTFVNRYRHDYDPYDFWKLSERQRLDFKAGKLDIFALDAGCQDDCLYGVARLAPRRYPAWSCAGRGQASRLAVARTDFSTS